MTDQEAPIFKASPADIVKRLKSIKLENKWTLEEMLSALNNNREGFSIAATTFKAIFYGQKPINLLLLYTLTAYGYDPYWVLTGRGEKKLTKEASTMITDIHKFRVELSARTARIDGLEANLNQAHKDIEYLKRELELLKRELKVI